MQVAFPLLAFLGLDLGACLGFVLRLSLGLEPLRALLLLLGAGFGFRARPRLGLARTVRLFLGGLAQALRFFLGLDARLGLGRGAGLGLRAQLGFVLGARARFLVGLGAGLELGVLQRFALGADPILELGFRREAHLGHDLGPHLLARLLLDVGLEQVFHLRAHARLDLFLQPRLELVLRALGFLRLLLRGGVRRRTRLRHRLRFGFGTGAGLGKRLGFLLRAHPQVRETPAFLFFLRFLLGGKARLLFRERFLARFLLAHLRLELDARALRGFLGALRLLHRVLLGLGLGASLGLELGARFRLDLRLAARGVLRLRGGLARGVGLLLLAHQLADVVGRAGHHALRGGGHLAGRGEVEIVVGGEGIGLFLARLEDARVAVLGEGDERFLELPLVDVGLVEELAEVRLAVDQLQDLHQVLR